MQIKVHSIWTWRLIGPIPYGDYMKGEPRSILWVWLCFRIERKV